MQTTLYNKVNKMLLFIYYLICLFFICIFFYFLKCYYLFVYFLFTFYIVFDMFCIFYNFFSPSFHFTVINLIFFFIYFFY